MSLKASKSPEKPLKASIDPSKGSIDPLKTPFFDEFWSISTQIVGLKVKYLLKESNIIDLLLKEREKSEKDSYRVTSIINYDFFNDLYAIESAKKSKGYLKTYLHDRLLDVLADYYQKVGYVVYKEKYLETFWGKRSVKGHADLILSNKILVEVKNYTEGHINEADLLRFIHQIMLYCYILDIETAFLVINNPKQYKKVGVFRILLGNTDSYRQQFIREVMLIPEYLENFKYSKAINKSI